MKKNKAHDGEDSSCLLAVDGPPSSDAAPIADSQPPNFLKEAIFAAGSFWSLESAFGRLDGVLRTSVGYFGGFLRKPYGREVSEGRTGHTEVVKVVYDSRIVSYRSICRVFWESHDPTDKIYLRFGVDTHYSSVIFYGSDEEKKWAQESKVRRQLKLNRRIVTKILPRGSSEFYLAEIHHQKYYLQKNFSAICKSLDLRSSEQFADSHFACKINGFLGEKVEIDEGGIWGLMASCDLPLKTRMAVETVVRELKDRRPKWVCFD